MSLLTQEWAGVERDLCQAFDRSAAGLSSTYLLTVRQQFNPKEIYMSNVINVFLQNFVASMVAVVMTGLLAWSVIDSTTTGSSDQTSVRNQA
jgi:hypothetical protein